MSNDYYTSSTTINYYPFTFTDNECVRFTDKVKTDCERQLVSDYWREQLNLYGQKIDYFVNNFSTVSADMLYGEHPTQQYSPPISIVAGINLNENALMLSKYGLVSDDEVTMFIHISAFYASFGGVSAEPKSGDLFKMTEYGNDRPGGRAGNFYEITQRLDQDIAQINPLAGHYVWLIKAKRFEYSFEPGLSGGETVNAQVYDDTLAAGVSGATKPYAYSTNTAALSVFNYNATSGFDDVYGGYA